MGKNWLRFSLFPSLSAIVSTGCVYAMASNNFIFHKQTAFLFDCNRFVNKLTLFKRFHLLYFRFEGTSTGQSNNHIIRLVHIIFYFSSHQQ